MNRLAIKILLILSMSTAVQATDEYLTLLGFKLEKTNLFEIQKRLGNVPIKHAGDAGDSYYGICYLSRENNATVYFESGEMGGHEHTLLNFVVKNALEKSQKCGELKNNIGDLRLGVIKLGKSIDEVRKELPQPVKVVADGLEYRQMTRLPFTKEDIERTKIKDLNEAYWDVSVTIRVFEENGTVSGYEVSKVTSW